MEPRQERFSIRKLSIGAASVLIGLSFMSMTGNQKVQAAEQQEKPAVVQNAKDNEQSQSSAEATLADKVGRVSSATTADKTATDSKLTQSPIQESSKDVSADPKMDSDSSKTTTANDKVEQTKHEDTGDSQTKHEDAGDNNVSTPQTTTLAINNTNTNGSQSRDKKVDSHTTLSSSLAAVPTAHSSQGQTLEVSDWNSFGAALINPNVGNIVLTNNITANGNVANAIKDNFGELDVTASNIARKLTIDGQGQHSIDFGTNFLAFTNANQGTNNSAWDLTLKDITVNGDGYQRTIYGGGYGTFYFGNVSTENGQKDTITLDGVTANIKQGPFIAGDTHKVAGGHGAVINVVLKGDNTINNNGVNADNSQLVNYGSTIQTGTLTVESGTTTMNVGTYKTNNVDNFGGNMFEIDRGTFTINEGATLNLNAVALDKDATVTDVRGIWTNDNPANTTQFGLNGTVTINGNLNANMGNGHSSAIVTGNVAIGKTGVVNINTKQDNNGVAVGTNGVTNFNGYHYAPISIAVGNVGNIASHDASLINEGSLTIKRDTTDASGTILPAAEPLIAFGSGGANNNTYIVKVGDGATLDLQDNAAVPSGWDSVGLNNPKISKAGLISLFGTSNEAVLDITNPYYLNFQRVGKDTVGNFIRLEGTVNGAYLNYNGVKVNSDKNKI
ncbi:MAG: YSIRK-type signal peptide-containing protein, partial [Lactobacillus sp.]|nr:YSIRK-type signal peptide-containing protein [Lactobacillus sp.]